MTTYAYTDRFVVDHEFDIIDDSVTAAGFHEDQHRDSHGRWAKGIPAGVEPRQLGIHFYSGAGFRQLNEALRKGSGVKHISRSIVPNFHKGDYQTTITLNGATAVRHLDAAIDDSPVDRDTTLYRGTTAFHTPNVGDVFTDKGYTSTSSDRNRAAVYYGGNGRLLWEITVPKGERALPIDEGPNTHEKEVLLPRGSSFKITDVSMDDRGQTVVKARVVHENGQDIIAAGFEWEIMYNTKYLTAATDVHTGAMIALVPSEDDAGRLAVDGGLPANELHCTIKYLGEAADITDENQDQILRRIEAAASALDAIDAEGFALAIFNPQGYSEDREPCTVLLVSGDELSETYEFICGMVHGVIDESYSHMPWIPHVTLSETGDADLRPLVDQVGPITFDRIRVAFAGQNYDFPFRAGQTGTDRSELETSEPPQAPELTPAVGSYTVDFESVFDLDHPDVQGWLNEYIAWAKERGVRSPGPVGHQLRDYWVYGPGAAKIRWNTEGDGTRCIKHMRKYVGVRAGGLCQYYHQLATGTTMGRHPGRPTEAAVGDVLPFDFDPHQPRDDHGRWRDTNPGNLHVMELADHVWKARDTKYGTTVLTGVDSHGSRHDLVSNGDGTISAYNEYGDDAHSTFDSKEYLLSWLRLSGENGGGADVKWQRLSVPEATAPIAKGAPKRVKVASPPDTTSSPELASSLERLTKVTNSDEVGTHDISSGQVGIVSKITTKDGSYIRKESKSWGSSSGKEITDAEDLIAELGIRIGAPVPVVDRVNNETVHMEFVDGAPAGEYFGIEDRDDDEYNNDPERAKVLKSRKGRLLGLLDLMTLNGDRHEYNWIIDKNGDPVGIDHGLGWSTAKPADSTKIPHDKLIKGWMDQLGSPFVPPFVPYDELFRRSDIEKARAALNAMETRFAEMRKPRWIGISRRVLDIIEEQMDMSLAQEAS